MSKRNTTHIYSIFSQIEEVAAKIMIERGLATYISAEDIPIDADVRYNDKGDAAKFAVSIQSVNVPVFEKMIRDLYA
jgi:hypothetical protein